MSEERKGETQTGETQREREIRHMDDLLQELRVILPGVQVLFAFLLVVVFSERFSEVTSLQRGVYFAALLFTTLAAAFLIAPTAQHRVLWRQGARPERLRIANGLAIAGTALLAAGMGCAIFLITDVLYGVGLAGAVTAMVVAVFAGLWFLLPLYQRLYGWGYPKPDIELPGGVLADGRLGDSRSSPRAPFRGGCFSPLASPKR